MSELNLTPGAERTLNSLQVQVREGQSSWFHLLVLNLLEGEGRATEILRGAGVILPAPVGEQAAADPSDYSEWQRVLIRRADHFARETNTSGPAGSEHLLLAAMELDQQILDVLTPFGLTLQSVLDLVTVDEPELGVPEHAIVQIRPANQGTVEEAGLYRILDASANRAREGLRVVEDYVRFRLNDAQISGELKSIRHLLTGTLKHLGQASWAASRDTLHDVGTLGTLASERLRGSLADVLRANLKRVEEALRSLEEYSKLLDSALSLKISECRYRMYTVEKALEVALQTRHRLEHCQLYLLVTADQCRYGAEQTIRHSVEKGVDVIQLREKGMSDRDLLRYAEQVRGWIDGAETLLIMNDRPDIAAAVGADGVHLGQDDLSVQAARQVMGGIGLIGVSTHTPEQARQAVFDGADYLGVGPVFPSVTKEFTEFAGLKFVQHVAESTCVPWFAIGGIQVDNLAEVQLAGATRVAVSSAICRAPHPRGVVSELKEKLGRPPARVRAKLPDSTTDNL
ncbi:thiamine phosphate synthase [Planctomicrobium sp. SH661]|uniref:thiamine phosphate synthase n=1 Tax=Planctomicrobium sp. SH661 TaxID=3448124 RepID=UPI003F5BA54A